MEDVQEKGAPSGAAALDTGGLAVTLTRGLGIFTTIQMDAKRKGVACFSNFNGSSGCITLHERKFTLFAGLLTSWNSILISFIVGFNVVAGKLTGFALAVAQGPFSGFHIDCECLLWISAALLGARFRRSARTACHARALK